MEIGRLEKILREISQWEIAEDEDAALHEPAVHDGVDNDVDTAGGHRSDERQPPRKGALKVQ